MLTIRAATNEADLTLVQGVFNTKHVIEYLGGFTMLQTLKDKAKPGKSASVWVAEDDAGLPIGAAEVAGRPQSHLMKYGEIGVIPSARRRRVATALYLAMTAQGVLEGRRLFEDTIVTDNPAQHQVLPSFGATMVGELKHRTASGLGICLYQFDLLNPKAWDLMLSRIPRDVVIEVVENHYTRELRQKNFEIFAKHPALAHMENEIRGLMMSFERDKRFRVTQGAALAHNAGKVRA